MSLQAAAPALVLASASSSRRALLAAAGLRFTACTADVDEAALKRQALAEGREAGEAALLLAAAKAQAISRAQPEALVLGADQLLVCEGRWFDKPAEMAAAAEHLRALAGRAHVLETAVVAWRGGAPLWQHLARPRLVMRELSEEFIAAYLTGEGEAVLSSVGAYRLEALGVHLFSAIEGEQSSILGLPMLPLLNFLRAQGMLLR